MNVSGLTGAMQVRIDGTYGLEPRKAAEEKDAKAPGAKGATVPAPAPDEAGGAQVVWSQEKLISSASAAPEIDARAVSEARALLESGQLDTPQAADRAAQRILDLGL
jgi:hypothetical protein